MEARQEDRVNQPLRQPPHEQDERRRRIEYDALVSKGQLDLFDPQRKYPPPSVRCSCVSP
jgi:hypothetical protein